ncbi:unnamed protein product, partial [Nesidiocoris tenuis]
MICYQFPDIRSRPHETRSQKRLHASGLRRWPFLRMRRLHYGRTRVQNVEKHNTGTGQHGRSRGRFVYADNA